MAKSDGGVPDIWEGAYVLHNHGKLLKNRSTLITNLTSYVVSQVIGWRFSICQWCIFISEQKKPNKKAAPDKGLYGKSKKILTGSALAIWFNAESLHNWRSKKNVKSLDEATFRGISPISFNGDWIFFGRAAWVAGPCAERQDDGYRHAFAAQCNRNRDRSAAGCDEPGGLA